MGKTKHPKKSAPYPSLENQEVHVLMEAARTGIQYSYFAALLQKIPFTLNEWADMLHLSNRTLQRYQKEKKSFDTLQSERILEISKLYNYGVDVFGDNEAFETWMNSKVIALGNVKPKSLLDNAYGIHMVKDVLGRIEHGIHS